MGGSRAKQRERCEILDAPLGRASLPAILQALREWRQWAWRRIAGEDGDDLDRVSSTGLLINQPAARQYSIVEMR